MALTINESFNPRSNSIGFLRWLMAFLVIFSHAGPLAGFYGSKNLGTQWSDEQSFGGVAVAGFFFLSGFLITRSRQGKSTIFRFFWARFLRIFPAFWAALILTAFVIAPIAWWHVHGNLSGYFSASTESPLTYFSDNMSLRLHQRNIAGMGHEVPLAACCGYDWNGSAWTLLYEFKGYIVIGVLGLFGILGYRILAVTAFGGILLLNTLTFLHIGANISVLDPLMKDFFNIMLLTPFLFGMVFALYGDKIPIDDRIAVAAGSIAVFTYFFAHGWNIYGQFGFLYVLMWCAVRLPLTNWERFGDMSYGLYIYAWPIMQLAAYFHLQARGWFVYHLVVAVVCHIAAYLSWHLMEKRALSLKRWTPRWLAAIMATFHPLVERTKRRLVVPEFSSSHFAKVMRHDAAALAAENGDLVTHDIESRLHIDEHHHSPPASPVAAAPSGYERANGHTTKVPPSTTETVSPVSPAMTDEELLEPEPRV
jgi:peptidoglycan/LPS O-acetylase OafA/YrhL